MVVSGVLHTIVSPAIGYPRLNPNCYPNQADEQPEEFNQKSRHIEIERK